MHLRLDVDVQKLEAKKLKKGKNKVEEDLDSLKTDYKKLRVSMRTTRLGKTSEQWRREIQEERNKADGLKKKCQETQVQNQALERNLLESRGVIDELKARIAKLERSLHRYRNYNTAVELRASLNKIEETKKRVEELETMLQDCETRIAFFEANEGRQKEQLHYYQSQVRDRDHVMGEAVT
ncbi:uncharacterized protein LOC105779001 [Gossypium raimondii]|uniref:uncharacterized protein LOC105779001 n=1 Tax=Gossypium raimondii TaxID=29730 RepID=UPI00063A9316|nr:uncharacterized protein LOC105779001 [Gossypium raimondii]